ncbi:hypothetical protein D3C81_1497730 [compost metagenome]
MAVQDLGQQVVAFVVHTRGQVALAFFAGQSQLNVVGCFLTQTGNEMVENFHGYWAALLLGRTLLTLT